MTTHAQSIVFLISALNAGGAERVAVLLCNYWASNGHKVTLIATYSKRSDCFYQVDPRVHVQHLADATSAQKTGPIGQFRRLLALRRAIQTAAPNRVISFLTNVNVAALLATIGTHIPVIVSERIFPPLMKTPLLLNVARALLYEKAVAVVMQSTDGLNWLKRSCPRARGIIIQNPVVYPITKTPPVVAPACIVATDQRLLVAVGRLTEQKRFDLLIDAFAKIQPMHPNCLLVILGEGPLRPNLARQIAELQLADFVKLPGLVGNIGDWYERADAFVMTSSFEGFPNTLLEALAHGIPAISFDVKTGPSDLIIPGANGYLIDPATGVSGLASALDRLLSSNCHSKARIAEATRSRFNLNVIAQQWLDISV